MIISYSTILERLPDGRIRFQTPVIKVPTEKKE